MDELEKDEYPELSEGAWVHTRTIEGHIVTGYIERRDALDGTVMVCVSHACCEQVGTHAWANMCDCELAGESKLTDTEGYIRNMIDLALDVRDERAFKHYTDALRKLTQAPNYRAVVVAIRVR